jgi:hypothetical protein
MITLNMSEWYEYLSNTYDNLNTEYNMITIYYDQNHNIIIFGQPYTAAASDLKSHILFESNFTNNFNLFVLRIHHHRIRSSLFKKKTPLELFLTLSTISRAPQASKSGGCLTPNYTEWWLATVWWLDPGNDENFQA